MKALAMALLVACGPGLAPKSPKQFATESLSTSIGDAKALAAMMHDSVVNAGLWFSNAECAQQFGMPAKLGPDRFDAFAQCLVGLHLETSSRKDSLPDVVVLRYPPGFEIEARVLDSGDGAQLTWIGWESRRDDVSGLPTISPETLEGLRLAGDRSGPLSPEATAAIEHDRVPGYPLEAWLQVCLDATGTVTGAHPREGTSLRVARTFAEAAKGWKFRPFAVDGQAVPICALVRTLAPVDASDPQDELPMPMPDGSQNIQIPAKILSKTRISGRKLITPGDREKVLIQKSPFRRFVGVFQLCLAESGRVANVTMVRTTGIPSYDHALEDAIRDWVYKPYMDEGRAVPVCSCVSFIYTQH